jgi:trans-aconitate methyltransferase
MVNKKFTLLFGENVQDYANYRQDYPIELFKKITDNVIGQKQVCVDLGAGTGLATNQLLNFFKQTISIEPDNLMAAKMELQLKKGSVKIIKGDFESLNEHKGAVNLINCSSSFHWLDHELFLKKALKYLSPNGLISVNNVNIFPLFDSPLKELMNNRFDLEWKAFCNDKLIDLIERKRVVSKLKSVPGFTEPKTFSFDNYKSLTTKSVLGFISTLSYFNSYCSSLSIERKELYLKDLEFEIDAFSINNIHKVNFQVHLFLINKL